MKIKLLLAIASVSLVLSCGTENDNITKEVNAFEVFTDSLLVANSEYVKGIDTILEEKPLSMNEPEIVVIDTSIVKHSNIFDTSHYITKAIQLALDKYNLLEQHLDSAKAKMDAKTLELYESIKGKVNEIKQPIK